MSETIIWLCPQCGTSYSDMVYNDHEGQCTLGHAPRSLVKHHGLLPKWRCKACGRRFSEPEYNINDGKCSFHQNTDLDPFGPEESEEPVQVVVETDEGEYDFGFGRSTPPASPASDEWQELYGGRLQKPVVEVMNETDLMARTIRVLVDKLGGSVELNPMEVMYIMMSRNQPIPNISREQTAWGSRVVLRIENNE